MANEKVKFKRGPCSNLPDGKDPGSFLVCTDTGDAYLDIDESTRIRVKDNSKEPKFGKKTAFNQNFETSLANIKQPGSASLGSSNNIARADHIHPAQTTVTGNAGTATKLATSRKIAGHVFDGTQDVNIKYSDILEAPKPTVVVDNVTSTSPISALSANQGKLLNDKLNSKAPLSHTHDDRYYTETEINSKVQALTTSINSKLSLTGGTVTGEINLQQGYNVHYVNSNNQYAYMKIAEITIADQYIDTPFIFQIVTRDKPFATNIFIKFKNGSTDPSLDSLYYNGNSNMQIYLHKTKTSVWSLYIRSAGYEHICVTDFKIPYIYLTNTKVKWKNEGVDSLPSGYVTATFANIASSALKLTSSRKIAGVPFDGTADISISYNNLTNRPSIPTPVSVVDSLSSSSPTSALSANQGKVLNEKVESKLGITDYITAGAQGSITGQFATAEGYQTTSTERCCHAEGYQTTASGRYSHSEGQGSKASGDCSHAEGDHTISQGDSCHVQGKYNSPDNSGKYAHIVGNGVSDSDRSNAHTIDWQGNAWFQGNIYLGGVEQDSGAQSLESIIESAINVALMTKVMRPGFIIATYENTNPGTYLGFGTWELTGQGRTLVGVDPSQPEFNTVKKTGGSKTHTLSVSELPSHNHAWSGVNDGAKVNAKYGNQPFRIYQDKDVNWPGTANSMKNTGGDAPHNNLQGYITCYLWTRRL